MKSLAEIAAEKNFRNVVRRFAAELVAKDQATMLNPYDRASFSCACRMIGKSECRRIIGHYSKTAGVNFDTLRAAALFNYESL